MDKVLREIKDGQIVKEAFDPNGIEGFGHVQENHACQSPLAEIPGYSFNEAVQLQGRTMYYVPCSRGVKHPPDRWEPPHATYRGA